MIEPLFDASKGALRAEGADVQLVDHGLVPGAATPGVVVPFECRGVDDLTRSVNVVGVTPRGGIGHLGFAIDPVAIAASGVSLARDELEPAARLCTHFERPRLAGLLMEHELDLVHGRSPEAKSYLVVPGQLRSERHVVTTSNHR